MPNTLARKEFVPQVFDGTRWDHIEPLVKELLTRPVRTPGEFERWAVDRSDLDAACSEAAADLYIAMTCATDDESKQRAYSSYLESIPPKLKPAFFGLDRRHARLVEEVKPDPRRYGEWNRAVAADVDLFRAENVPIETELSLLAQKYDQIAGGMSVVFEGKEQTLPMMARYQEVTDRSVREAAWRAVVYRRLQDEEALHTLFDEMVAKRDRVAKNAGCADFVAFTFKAKHRFDYTPASCEAFHRAVERHVVPILRSLDRRRASALGLGALRPWDLAVDVRGRGPLRPFTDGRDLMRKSVATFDRLDPRLGTMLRELGDGSNTRGAEGGACLDLDARKGKAPGGYQQMRDRVRRPFIFMNAAGLSRDVVILLHEAGHAFHSMLCVGEPLVAYRRTGEEIAEVASMTMELLTLPHLSRRGAPPEAPFFYERDEDLARHTRQQLERSITILPWIATIDAFQHWIYTHPTHTRAEREAAWLALDDRFGNALDWSGLERVRASLWHRQIHLFTAPLYYIEYGIAQLGAFGLWLHAKEKGEKSAIEAYLKALSLGGSRPLPDLFAAAGLPFDFGDDAVGRIAERVAKELDALPD